MRDIVHFLLGKRKRTKRKPAPEKPFNGIAEDFSFKKIFCLRKLAMQKNFILRRLYLAFAFNASFLLQFLRLLRELSLRRR